MAGGTLNRRYFIAGASALLATRAIGQGTTSQRLSVTSADGTTISYQKIGSGRSLVIIPGAIGTSDDWMPVARKLSNGHSCLVMDRRGFGQSGPRGENYSMARETEDVSAVLEAAGKNPALLGHSYGAVCALETARLNKLKTLILYEPPLPLEPPAEFMDEAITYYRSLLDRGAPEEALIYGLKTFVHTSEDEIAAAQATPLWSGLVERAPKWLPELEVLRAFPPGVERYEDVKSRTLLLMGGKSARAMHEPTFALNKAMRKTIMFTMAQQSHIAHITAPDEVAKKVDNFLQS